MNIAYIRTSTHKQDTNNQKNALVEYAFEHGLGIDKFVIEEISSRKQLEERKLYQLINELKKGDTLLIYELSRLGRSMFEIMEIINLLHKKGVKVTITNKDFTIQDNIQSKTYLMALTIAAEVERDLIRDRTRIALAKAKKEGIRLGRPKGKISRSKLDPKKEQIQELLNKGVSKNSICKIVGCSYPTLQNFIKTRKLTI